MLTLLNAFDATHFEVSRRVDGYARSSLKEALYEKVLAATHDEVHSTIMGAAPHFDATYLGQMFMGITDGK